MRIAHFSDPHFAVFSSDLRQFLSKRWIGNLNLLLNRSKNYQEMHLRLLPALFKTLEVKTVCLTGDLTTTSLDSEFELAKEFVGAFEVPFHIVPGNHDCYTKEAEKNGTFYRYFPNLSLQTSRIDVQFMGQKWWWVGIDAAIATPIGCSYGLFTLQMQHDLRKTLEAIPKDDHIIIGNHFPLYPKGSPHHHLKGADLLQNVVHEFQNIRLYLHGHDHHPYTRAGSPFVLNAGSSAHKRLGAFTIIDLSETEFSLQNYVWKGIWEKDWLLKEHFSK